MIGENDDVHEEPNRHDPRRRDCGRRGGRGGRRGDERRRGRLPRRVRRAGGRGRRRDDPRHGRLDRLDDQGDHRGRRDAARRAGAARIRRPRVRGDSRPWRSARSRRVRRRRHAADPPGADPDHPAPPPHPHLRLRLRHLERRHGALPGGDGDPGHHRVPGRLPHHPPHVRPRRALGLRHRHRLGGEDGGGGERAEARRVSRGPPARAARHERHRVPDLRCDARASGQDPHARRRRLARAADGARDPAGARVRDGRGRTLRNRRRLPPLHPHDPQPGPGERQAAPRPGDRGHDVPQPDGRHAGPRAQDRDPAVLERRGVLPRAAQDLGTHLHDQRRGGADGALGGEPRVGGPRQLLLLDRSREGGSGAPTSPRCCHSSIPAPSRSTSPSSRRSTRTLPDERNACGSRDARKGRGGRRAGFGEDARPARLRPRFAGRGGGVHGGTV